ncbi:uncharacterized protein PHALS_00701 [Plasmopara halstedii]|uniref:Uncharacterized protein n=1 Tax=Plasmopara halstedii TaxID=4781 RepID=A0A0P1ARU5_PLAHL|nr:uncharacterized protein PHALS_00701 [Plasmopara halstedii]CEG44332.1 hypothetical protein PHALS_00701 [Plasmopara halstedii]|eukprot:XP_024580701.1 hypothetical protein PHALS_00701 [Plasmopara halstedii]
MKLTANMSSHQAIMKCPWQWRQPFLDEKRESRKRKKFCGADKLELDEKENIQREIERLMTKKSNELLSHSDDAKRDDITGDTSDFDVICENQALVDSILLMSKSVEASSLTLLASPKSVMSSSSSSDSDEEDISSNSDESFDLAEDRPAKLIALSSPSLELVSDSLQEPYFAVEDSELLDFPSSGVIAAD